MRVLIYGINFAPELIGVGRFTGDLAKWLAERGHKVRVVTAPPYYPGWRVHAGYSAFRYRKDAFDGVEVRRCPIWVPHTPAGWSRVVHLLSFVVTSAPCLAAQVSWRPDVILTIAPTLLCAPVARAFARTTHVPAWLHVHDFEFDIAQRLGFVRLGSLDRMFAHLERFCFGGLDKVSTISNKMAERLAAKGVSPSQIELFPNWVDTSVIKPLATPSSYRTDLGISKTAVVALYAGNMGEKQGLETVVDAAQALARKDEIRFVLAGNGVARCSLQAATEDMQNVYWLPLQPDSRLNDLLNLADIHLLPQRPSASDLVMPSKLSGMFASGRPVVAAAPDDSEVARLVQGRGRLVTPGSGSALADSILVLAADRELREELGHAGRIYACNHLDRDVVLTEFERKLTQLALRKGRSG